MVLIKFFSKHLEGIIINKDVDFDKLEHCHYSKISSIVTHIKKQKNSLDSMSLQLPPVILSGQMTYTYRFPVFILIMYSIHSY